MKDVYLSGPISGLPMDNRDLFEHYRRAALEHGAQSAIVPHDLFEEVDTTGYKWEDYMKVCIAALLGAEVILLLPGWQDSRGAKLEAEVAQGIGIPRIYYTELAEKENV